MLLYSLKNSIILCYFVIVVAAAVEFVLKKCGELKTTPKMGAIGFVSFSCQILFNYATLFYKRQKTMEKRMLKRIHHIKIPILLNNSITFINFWEAKWPFEHVTASKKKVVDKKKTIIIIIVRKKCCCFCQWAKQYLNWPQTKQKQSGRKENCGIETKVQHLPQQWTTRKKTTINFILGSLQKKKHTLEWGARLIASKTCNLFVFH